jgi:O-antigen/teichoic acid export membrane protein
MLARRNLPLSKLRTGAQHRWLAELAAMAPKLVGTLGTSGAAAALGIVSGTIAARVLGPSHRGELALLLLWPQLVITIGNVGIDAAAVYLSGDEQRQRDVPATVLGIALAQSLVLVPVYLILAPIVLRGSGLTRDALLLTPLIPMYLAGSVSIFCLSGQLRFAAFNSVRISLPIMYCAGIAGLALTGQLTALTGALAFLVAHGCSDLLALALVWRGSGLGRFNRGLARSALHFGLRSHVGRLSAQSLGVDMAIISLMLSSKDLGLYSAATAFLAAPTIVASSIGLVIFPHVSATHQAGKRQQLSATFALHAGLVVVLAVLLIVFAHPVVTLLFGQSYAGAAPALRLLAFASIAISIRSFPVEVLRGIGRPGLTSIAEAANWLLFLAAIPVGAHVGGLVGTAAAVALASYASVGVLVLLMWRSGVFSGSNAAAEAVPSVAALEAA